MKQFLVLICSLFSLSFFGCRQSPKIEGVVQISPEDLNKTLQDNDIQLIDVRTPKEYKSGFIKTAKNINFFSPSFSNDIKALNPERPVYIYCRSGKRSGKSVSSFLKARFKKIYNLEGGMLHWKEQDLEIAK